MIRLIGVLPIGAVCVLAGMSNVAVAAVSSSLVMVRYSFVLASVGSGAPVRIAVVADAASEVLVRRAGGRAADLRFFPGRLVVRCPPA